jgi:hypothetical protein
MRSGRLDAEAPAFLEDVARWTRSLPDSKIDRHGYSSSRRPIAFRNSKRNAR